jgi:hypothetical protein
LQPALIALPEKLDVKNIVYYGKKALLFILAT